MSQLHYDLTHRIGMDGEDEEIHLGDPDYPFVINSPECSSEKRHVLIEKFKADIAF